MKKKNLLLTFLLAALILGLGAKAWCYDFAQIEEHGQTLYYTITSNVEPYTVKVTYPYADATVNGQAYGKWGEYIDKPTGDISIPNSVIYDLIEYKVTAIDKWTFNACDEITSVLIPNNVESIGTYALNGCTALANLTIGTGVKTLENYAFQSCTGLTNITLNATLTSVPTNSSYYAFKNCACKNVCTLTIGSEVTSIPDYTFSGLSNVGTIYFNATNCADFTSAVNFTLPNDGGYFYIGDNVLRIPAFIFQYKKIAHLTIGSSVTEIGDKSLTSFSLTADIISKPSTPPTVYANTFPTGTKNYPVYVPAGSQSQYQEATGWSSFNNYKEFTEYTTSVVIDESTSKDMIIFNGGSLTIENGATFTCNNIIGATPSNLTIADGGQLITNNPVNATLQKGINAALVWGEPGADAWYFIASPVDGYETSNVIITGITDTDLYSFDEESGYWFNGQGTDHPFTTLNRGQGYLYANSTGNDLSFLGTMPATNTTIEKPLSFAGSGSSKGFNLMGNPFTCNLTSDNVKIQDGETQTSITTYYIVENGTELATMNLSTDQIKPGRGFLIQADKEGQKLVFNPAAKRNETKVKPSFIRIEAGNADFMDRAYVQIGQGNTLRKMTINDNVSHVYVMSEGKDYAAATIQEAQGEMPVNFKANENGQYTITVNPENVALDYLHLVDNITGADIDLLATPSYTFNAKTTDYASRFRLLFAANGIEENGTSTSSATFAFISNGQLVVNGTGTLQIIDMTGRVVSTKSTEERISTNELTPGVYVVKLMGNETKTQKIVIE